MDITLVVNNLGGTSYLELFLVTNSAVRYLGKVDIMVDNNTLIIIYVSQQTQSKSHESLCWYTDDITGNGRGVIDSTPDAFTVGGASW